MIGSLSNHCSRKSPADRAKIWTRSRWPSIPSGRRRLATRAVQQFAQGRHHAASCRHVRRRLEGDRAQNVGHALEPRLIGVETLGVAGRELGDLGFRAPGRRLQIAAIGKGQEVGERPLDDPQAVPREIEIPDDRRMEQRNGVGGDGIAESGMKFLRCRRAADDGAPLDHRDLQSRRREIGGRDQAVVAAADDDDVAHSFARRVRHRKSLLRASGALVE